MTACKIIILIVFCLGLCGIGFAGGWCFGYDKREEETMSDTLEMFESNQRQLEIERRMAYQVGRNAALSLMQNRGLITKKQAEKIRTEWRQQDGSQTDKRS